MHPFNATLFSKDGPVLAYEAGLFYVCYIFGGARLELVMQPHTFLKALRKGNQLAAEFTRSCNVLPLREDDPVVEDEDQAVG